MRRQTLTGLAVTAALAAVLAVIVLWQQRPETPAQTLLLPDFAARLADVAAVDITAAKTKMRLELRDGHWVVADKAGYPADGALVRRLLLGVANARVVETKTSNADNYARLGVEDPGSPNAASTQVDFRTADGAAVAGVIVGKSASGPDRRYARVAGADVSYLVSGLPEVKAAVNEWLDDKLLNVDQARVKAVVVSGGPSPLTMTRAQPETDFQLAELPKGRTLKKYGGVDSLTASLAYLAFDDVRPAAEMPAAARTQITTFDGLTVTVVMDGGWAHFAAAYDSTVATAEGEAVMPKAPSDVEKEAADINARLAGWDYKLPDYKLKDLAPALADLLEPLPQKDKGKK